MHEFLDRHSSEGPISVEDWKKEFLRAEVWIIPIILNFQLGDSNS